MPVRTPLLTHVRRTERLSTSLVRVVVGGPSLASFRPVHVDSYVKIVFDDPATPGATRMRTYTVRAFDPVADELTLDFVVHGASGLAGPWAANARPGDELRLLGPGGGYTPDPTADFHVLAGDESALPAIAAALESLPAGAPAHAFIEVAGPGDHIELAGEDVTWLHRGSGRVGSRLTDALTGWTVPAGRGHWFVHGEAAMVRDLRRHLRRELGLPMEQLSISGYWRAGVDDEGWRAVKRDWNRSVEESEQDVPALR